MRLPSNHFCLGLRLEQLSIGHIFLLADVSSPFLDGGHGTLIDLSNSVFICSQPWRVAAGDCRRWWFKWFLKAWARRSRRMDQDVEQAKFAAYFAEQTDFPVAKIDERNMREFGSSWWWRLLAIMMADFHLSEAAALDMPAAKAAMLYSARGEVEGKLKLWNKSDDAFDDFCQRMDSDPNVKFPPPTALN